MRNLVINCNVLVSDDFDEEKAIESVTGAFIFNLLPKEHLGWEAPDRSEILAIDKDYVLMKQDTFDRLLDYTNSEPTGKYNGKMWKAKNRKGEWFLCWFNHQTKKYQYTNYRKILILD